MENKKYDSKEIMIIYVAKMFDQLIPCFYLNSFNIMKKQDNKFYLNFFNVNDSVLFK